MSIDGRVKWYNRTRGYGFISTLEETARDVFVHHSAIKVGEAHAQGKYLVQGEYVTVQIEEAKANDKGHRFTITEVKGLHGNTLMCELERRRPAAKEKEDDGFTTVPVRRQRTAKPDQATSAPGPAASAPAPAPAPAPAAQTKPRGRPRKNLGPMPSQ